MPTGSNLRANARINSNSSNCATSIYNFYIPPSLINLFITIIHYRELSADKPAVESENKIQLKLDHVREQLNGAQKTLGEKNVAVSRLKRQLDSVPGNAELNQYQRRFTELCTQGFISQHSGFLKSIQKP